MNPTNYLRDFRKSKGDSSFCARAARASKFTLPDELTFKELAGPDFRGLSPDADLRLPFPQVLIEIPGATRGRLVILAWEEGLLVRVAATCSTTGNWSPPTFCGALPRRNWLWETGGLRMAVEDRDGLPEFSQWCVEAVAALCSILACSNVRIEQLPANPKLAKAAAKRGALPFDTYHVLTVGAASSGSQRLGQSDGRSPREHLRRGHIRRLDDGRRLWINATVVNPGVGGTVSKAYAVR